MTYTYTAKHNTVDLTALDALTLRVEYRPFEAADPVVATTLHPCSAADLIAEAASRCPEVKARALRAVECVANICYLSAVRESIPWWDLPDDDEMATWEP